ncbi:MAG: AAA family ATPase, partial [Chitinispirillales bacterium]|nr:AAA family ATPase [Chitinispirillales bacterium]
MVQRPQYVKRLLSFKDRNIIKIVTGVRRCGKSTLFELYRDELTRRGVEPGQIQSINLEDLANEHLRDYRKLYEQITQNL